MTNGEKMQEIFPEGETRKCRDGVVFESDGWCHAYGSDWWNTEYKEPTTKNCKSCRYYGLHHEVCNYCYECSLWTEGELTTKNDLGVDCISRADLYNRIKKIDHDEDYECDEFGGNRITYHTCDWDEVLREIEDAPSVTPQEPRWIPVSEYLPVTNDEVLVTYIVNGNAKKRYVETANCFDGEWSSVNDEYRIPNTKIEIVAWMPLPKAYREVEE